jgi:transposase
MHTATFRAKVAVAALRGDSTIAEVTEKFEIHPNQVTAWKVQLMEHGLKAFGEKAVGTPAPYIAKIEATTGRLILENGSLESALIKARLLCAKI